MILYHIKASCFNFYLCWLEFIYKHLIIVISMKYINFIVGAIAWVPYFIPLVIEGNKRGISSYFFIRENPKAYANPISNCHRGILNKIAKIYNIKVKDVKDVVN